jgi:hypothetical protein
MAGGYRFIAALGKHAARLKNSAVVHISYQQIEVGF